MMKASFSYQVSREEARRGLISRGRRARRARLASTISLVLLLRLGVVSGVKRDLEIDLYGAKETY